MFELKTTRHKAVFDLFKGRVTCSGDPAVKLSKPAPDCYLTAMSRLPNPTPADEIIVFEDAINGVCAGRSAGMHVSLLLIDL